MQQRPWVCSRLFAGQPECSQVESLAGQGTLDLLTRIKWARIWVIDPPLCRHGHRVAWSSVLAAQQQERLLRDEAMHSWGAAT